MTTKKTPPKTPKPDRVKIDGDWENALGKALKKKRPKDGWPSGKIKSGKPQEK